MGSRRVYGNLGNSYVDAPKLCQNKFAMDME
jgi:hypothetical protein